MSKVSVFDHAWIDLVFEGRNQNYGAYQLRRQDSKTTSIALLSGIGLMVALAGAPALINYFSPKDIMADTTPGPTVIEVTDLDTKIFPPKPEVVKPDPIVEPPASTTPPKPAASGATTKFTPLVATSGPVDTPPNIETVLTTNPGTVTDPGTPGGLGTTPTPNGVGGTGTTPTPDAGTGIENLASVDVMPVFPGGMQRFYEEVGRKFRTPDTDKDMTLKVYVSFVIEKDGTMTNIKVMRDPGYEMGKEALRVLQSIKTKWTAGKKAGQPVRTAYNLPITVNVK